MFAQSKIVRVLNLWQKNSVIPTDIIQPLMDLAKDPQEPALFQSGEFAAAAYFVSVFLIAYLIPETLTKLEVEGAYG